MKAFLASMAVAVVLAIGVAMGLQGAFYTPAYQQFSTTGARVGAPGDNLVGRNWYNPNGG
ncbi:MAG: hypothetical protein EAZ99_02585 [Alphaproteobacteria bacterium]|nr:hypothetical protein [Alphaproteobacteria bacterium]TAD91551.1 MAG: hypothetical protein EAZ99_02585 [Alphaproteobacteria bacterium]